MPLLADIAAAARIAQNPKAYLTCRLRGARIGERACTSCKGRTMLHVFACPHHPDGVTYKDCEKCALPAGPPDLLAGELPDDSEPFDGEISLLINVYNEGPDLLETVRSFRSRTQAPLHVIVFADRTTDGSLDGLEALDTASMTILRHDDSPAGCGRAKAEMTSGKYPLGDFVVHSDGHNRLLQLSLDYMARLGTYANGVIQPALGPLHCRPDRQPTEKPAGNCYYGGKLTVEKGMPNIHQTTLRPDRPIKRTQCVNNSCFGYPRSLLNRFAGWHEFPGKWGFQEAGFSIRLWFAGVPIYVLRDMVVHHRYQDWWTGDTGRAYTEETGRKRATYSVAGWERRANRRYAARVCFDASAWAGYWREQFERVDCDSDGKAAKALDASAVERQHAEFETVKKRTDLDWWKEVAGMDFDPATAKVNDGVTRGLYLISGGLGNALMCVPAMKALAQLSGGPIDVWDRGLHAKGLCLWLDMQPWVNAVLTDRPDYRDYRYVIGSYWSPPELGKLDGCTISPAVQQHRTKHEALSNIEAVRRAGFTGPTPGPDLILDPATMALSTSADETVVICTEAAGRRDDVNKCYPHWEAVCRQLHAAGVALIFLGNNKEAPAWMDEVGVNLVGKTEFMHAIRIVAAARLYVGIDNGLGHVATAARTPLVLLYGPTSLRKNLQLTQAVHIIESGFACAPCFDTHRKNRCKAEPKGAMPCMRAIAPERVAQKVLHLLDMPYADALPAKQIFLSRKQMVENLGAEMFQQWDELTALLDLIRPVDPQTVLVIGTHHAAWEVVVSGVCAPGTGFIMVDRDEHADKRILCEQLLDEVGYPHIFIRGDSTAPETVQAVRDVLAEQRPQVVYIDGDHTYETVEADWKNYGSLCAPGGIVIFHDVANYKNADADGSRRHWAELKGRDSTWMTQEIRRGKTNGYGIVWMPPAEQPVA